MRVIALTLVAAGVALAAGAPGELDAGFGTGGVAAVDVPFEDGVYATVYKDAVRLSNGRVVLVGVRSTGNTLYVTAVDSTGAVDTAFGSGGVVTPLSNGTFSLVEASADAEDRILLCTSTTVQVGTGKKAKTVGAVALVRLTASGALDATFGSGGVVLDTGAGWMSGYRAITQSDGKIVVAGAGPGARSYACALIRYLGNGQRDASFGSGGVVIDDVDPDRDTYGKDVADRGLAIDSQGRLVVGSSHPQASNTRAISRYLPSGALDTTFGSAGRVYPNFLPWSVSVDGQDRVVACGTDGAGIGVVRRYTAAGAPDSAFGTNGTVTDPAASLFFEAAAEPGGELLVTGHDSTGVRSITRLLGDGALDLSWGTDGHAEGPVVSTAGGQCPVLLGPTTVALSIGAGSGTHGSPWYVEQFQR
jgi:uncharacterized delta-60 repeat protein